MKRFASWINVLAQYSHLIEDPKIKTAQSKLLTVKEINVDEADAETIQGANERILEVKQIIATIREEHSSKIQQAELDDEIAFYNEMLREQANDRENTEFDNFARSAQREIDRNGKDFGKFMSELGRCTQNILRRQDWYIVQLFRSIETKPNWFSDQAQFDSLVSKGNELIRVDDIDGLREVLYELVKSADRGNLDSKLSAEIANIVKG